MIDSESRALGKKMLLECFDPDLREENCPRLKRRKGSAIQCPYPGAPFGEGGVLHSIGTDHGTKAWSNPHTDGKVVAAMSNKGNAPDTAPHKFVGRSNDNYSRTKDEPNSWMSVDLGEGRAVVPTHYCLRSDTNNAQMLRNWTLEGKTAEAGADWVQIRRHDRDATLATEAFSVGAWPIEGEERAFRHFRIRQHGHNACGPGYDCLMCCGFEVYGELTEA